MVVQRDKDLDEGSAIKYRNASFENDDGVLNLDNKIKNNGKKNTKKNTIEFTGTSVKNKTGNVDIKNNISSDDGKSGPIAWVKVIIVSVPIVLLCYHVWQNGGINENLINGIANIVNSLKTYYEMINP